jgi:DNA-binding YbaB/EbfC family protein
MNPKQLQEMMEKAQDMQRQMQEKMKNVVAEAAAGGGAVSAKVNGQKELISVTISPELMQSGDLEMLQDLVVAAVNSAGRKAEEAMQSQLGGMLGGMGLPPGLF